MRSFFGQLATARPIPSSYIDQSDTAKETPTKLEHKTVAAPSGVVREHGRFAARLSLTSCTLISPRRETAFLTFAFSQETPHHVYLVMEVSGSVVYGAACSGVTSVGSLETTNQIFRKFGFIQICLACVLVGFWNF